MTRGGARPGAGRPVKPDKKKPCTFKLSVAEEFAVRQLLKEMRKKMKKYIVRFGEKQSGWVTIAEVDKLEDAIAEFDRQLEEDKKNGYTDNRTEIIDGDGNIIKEFEGENY